MSSLSSALITAGFNNTYYCVCVCVFTESLNFRSMITAWSPWSS